MTRTLLCFLALLGFACAAHATDPADLERRNRTIAVLESRRDRDPGDFLDLGQLAGLYLQRARETGSHDDLHKAEAASRLSLGRSTVRNGRSYVTLANALMGLHRFAAADSVVRLLVAREPDVDSYRALGGELQLELGDYDAARATFAALAAHADDLAIAPRLARWLELRGRVDESRALLRDACATAVRRQSELPREQLAWFHLRLGDLEARYSDARAAEASYLAGLKFDATDHRLLLARARLAAAAGRWPEALALAQSAAATVPDLPALLMLRDACAATGDTTRTMSYARAAAQRVTLEHARFNRPWTLDQLDHGRDLAATLAQLESEIEGRPDVYGWDLLGWALLANGRPQEARAAMTQALRLGTRDPLLLYHVGKVELALGNVSAAHDYLSLALGTNPQFQGAADARQALADLADGHAMRVARR